MGVMTSQREVIAFLRDPSSYPSGVEQVDVRETHAALIFLAGDEAIKIKKAVRYPYLDFSTLEKRKQVCLRELDINQPHAPGIYRDVIPICRAPDGRLSFSGSGEPVEWAVRMNRFADDAVLSVAVVQDEPLPDTLFDDLARAVAGYHASAPTSKSGRRIIVNIEEVCQAFSDAPGVVDPQQQLALKQAFARHEKACRHRLASRRRRGYVRRCHGDLHLNNVVVLDGKPVLFDAIEFDEDIATIDILYDLAFLIMDLEHGGRRAQANRLFNRYLAIDNDAANIAGLQAMPLFLALRAAIRAMVDITRLQQLAPGQAANKCRGEIGAYLQLAEDFLAIAQPQLVCIAGLSGTGKTTLAHRLAPQLGRAPGALHLRSDVERKAMFGVAETDRLDPSTYTREISHRIYRRLMHKARLGLLAGQGVVIDAVFLGEAERQAAEDVAKRAGASFAGIWLEAERDTTRARVTARSGDASDATEQVVLKQMQIDPGPIAWHKVDASGSLENTYTQCRQHLS